MTYEKRQWKTALAEIKQDGFSTTLQEISDQNAWLDWVLENHDSMPAGRDKDGLYDFRWHKHFPGGSPISADNPINVLSLGWGLQSWTMAAMAALGDLPKPDFAVFSDTGWERQATLEFSEKWDLWLYMRGVIQMRVYDIDAHGMINNEWEGTFIPAYTLDQKGNQGQLRRQCTSRWKIQPMRRFVRGIIESTWYSTIHKDHALIEYNYDLELAEQQVGLESEFRFRDIGYKIEDKFGRNLKISPGCVKMWIGITVDEIERVKPSDVKWAEKVYPLLDLNMSRKDCVEYLLDNKLPIPPKSSCVY